MPHKPLGLRERNRIRTRGEILIAMSTLLSERSFEEITVDEVAKRAGVSRGTIYTYFPEGRDQLLRDAYLRIAEHVASEGAAARERFSGFTDRVVALATVLADVAVTPEGRFYGAIGPHRVGPLGGVTGTASGAFHIMLVADLKTATAAGTLHADTPVEELATLIGGAVREIGVAAARDPERAPRLLHALRVTCDALLASQ